MLEKIITLLDICLNVSKILLYLKMVNIIKTVRTSLVLPRMLWFSKLIGLDGPKFASLEEELCIVYRKIVKFQSLDVWFFFFTEW